MTIEKKIQNWPSRKVTYVIDGKYQLWCEKYFNEIIYALGTHYVTYNHETFEYNISSTLADALHCFGFNEDQITEFCESKNFSFIDF